MSLLNLRKENHRYLFGIAAGLVYGLAIRFLFGYHGDSAAAVTGGFWVMTAGFLVFVPFFMGWITASAGQTDGEAHWARWIFSPWIAILLGDVFVFVAGIEGMICIIFAIPITLAVGSIGGIAGGLAARTRILSQRAATLCLALLPFLVSGIEAKLNAPLTIRTVHTSIVIHAPAEVVWRNIERVPRIDPSEIHPSWTHRIGFPLPEEATLDHEGVGGVRHASFAGGLLFIETIDRWKPLQQIGFTIAADTAHIPPTTLDEHVTIGGRYFDVLDGEYDLEPLANGDILLHLSSRERLSTDFNAYAALWTDGVMRDLQQSILEVVKRRCEGEAATPAMP